MNGRGWMGRTVAAGLLLVGLGGCAGAGLGARAGTSAGGATMLMVENNLAVPTTLSIYAVPEVGTRIFVGTVTSSANATLRFDPIGAAGRYRLVAETTTGAEIVSNPISFSPGATIRWNLSANLASVRDPG